MIHRDIALRRNRRAPTRKGIRLADVAGFVNRNGQAACDTAAACSATPSPITTVPVRELNTTRARIFSACTCTSSSCDINATRAPGLVGARTVTLVELCAVAIPPNEALIAAAMLLASLKRRAFQVEGDGIAHLKSLGISRSTVAPLGINPAVGVLTVTLEPLAPVAFIPPTTTLPCARA